MARCRPAPRIESDLKAGNFEPPCPHCGAPLEPALVSENVAPDPRNAYASSKMAQEFYASNWARVTGGSVAALRYHNVYGPGMPRDTPYAGVAAIFTSALGAAKRRRYSRTANNGAISCMCAMSRPRRSRHASSTFLACARSMSDRERRARSATWRGLLRRRYKALSRS